jgi:hypothetical protein
MLKHIKFTFYKDYLTNNEHAYAIKKVCYH